MAVTNLYSNLPGHLVEFKDGGLQLTSSPTDTSSTKSLLILGTATDGPINEPVKIDVTTVSQVFGKEVNADGYPNGATLTKYAKQAFKNGFDDVRCMRVTGSQAYTTIYGQETTSYIDKTGSIRSDGEDEKIKGNTAFSYDFTTRAENPIIVAKEASGDAYFTVNGVRVGLSQMDTNAWSAYRGFTIPANKYAMLSELKLTCKGIQFVAGDNLVDAEEATATVAEDENNDNALTAVITRASDGENPASIFTDKDAHGIASDIFPDMTNFDNDGFLVSKNDTRIAADNYEVTVADETITFVFRSGVEAGDEIKVTYYPYTEVTVEENFEDAFNATVAPSTMNTSRLNELEEVEITAVTAGGVQVEAYTNESGVLTISDTTGIAAGSEIIVAYNYKEPVTSDLELKVKSQWGGSLYKDATVEVKKVTEGTETYTEIVFTKPTAKTTTQATKSFSYSSKYYQTVDDLILGMKNDLNNLNLFEVEIVKGEGTDRLDLLAEVAATALSEGGEDGLKPTNDEMFIALSGDRYTEGDIGTPISAYSTELVTEEMVGLLKTQGAYQILENYNVDYIYPAGVYADAQQNVNPNSDFQRELALVCAVLTYRTKMTHGFIDVKPNSNTTLVGIDAYVAKLINSHRNIYYMTDANGDVIYDSENKPMDIGWYTSCVAGPEVVMTSDVLGTYYGSPAIAYAALNSVIEPQSSPLNKALRNVNGIKFKFSNKQMDALIGSRMVCFKLKNEGTATSSSTPYVVDGVTSGAPGCDYSDIMIVKVVTDVVDNIREVADPFIGEQNTVEQRNALSALISKRLTKLVELGEIQSYEFEVSATIQQQLLGEASIALTIIPAMTLRKITTVVALRAAQ